MTETYWVHARTEAIDEHAITRTESSNEITGTDMPTAVSLVVEQFIAEHGGTEPRHLIITVITK